MIIIDWLQILAVVAGSLTTITTACFLAYKYILKPVHITVQIAGAIIERELAPNGGSSVLDRLVRIESKINSHMISSEENALALKQHIQDNTKHIT